MCWQDIQIGRKTYSALLTVDIYQYATEIVQANPRRTSLIFSSSPEDGYWIDVVSSLTQWTGFFIAQNSGPLILTLQQHGDIVRSRFFAISAGLFTQPTMATGETSLFPVSSPYAYLINAGVIETYLDLESPP